MKHLFALFWLALALIGGVAQAAEPQTVGQVRKELIINLMRDGALAPAPASTAMIKYVTGPTAQAAAASQPVVGPVASASQAASSTQAPTAEQEGVIAKYATWGNFISIVGVIFLLIAFHGILMNFIKGIWHLIVAVPVELYQGVLGFCTLFYLIKPEMLVASYPFYVALFCAFAFPMVLSWFVATHEAIAKRIAALFNLGLPVGSIVSAYATVYFVVLAFAYHSQIFGFFAVVAFSGVLTFGLTYRPGVLELDFKEPALPAVIFGHLILIGLYVVATMASGDHSWLTYFKAGVEYYATIALMCGLLCGASPWYGKSSTLMYAMMQVGAFLFATMGFSVLGFPVMSSVIIVFSILWLLEWMGYAAFSANWIVGCLFTGIVLFIGGNAIQTYGHTLVFHLASK